MKVSSTRIGALMVATLLAVVMVAEARAEKKVYACQNETAAGISWKDGKWTGMKFVPLVEKFILVVEDGIPTSDSINKAANTPDIKETIWQCTKAVIVSDVETDAHSPAVSCQDGLLTSLLVFNEDAMIGGISRLYGAVMGSAEYRDTPMVETFSCVQF